MLWDDPGDSRNMQRLKNGIFLKMWVSNDTRDDAMPVMGIITLLIIVGAIVYAVVKA
jgi:hypothetical protein